MKKYIFLLLIPILFSCEKIFFEEDLMSTDPQTNLDYLWKECDEKYSYFDLKGVSWDQIKLDYSAKLYDDMSNDSLFKVLAAMLNELRDGHVNLISNINVSFYPIDTLGQDNFNWRTLTDNYLPSNYYTTGPFQHDFLLNTNQRIGYIRFQSFSGITNDQNLDFLLEKYRNTEGLIMDMRENGGGDPLDIYNMFSRFVNEKTLIFYSRFKSGPGHNEFGAVEASYVEPSENLHYEKKVVILTDRRTYSAGSFTALASKAIPNIILMGDTTGGGLGAPNGGQLPNGWRYRFSVSQTLNLDMDPSWENGVPPDITVTFNWNDLATDEVIEAAVQEILP